MPKKKGTKMSLEEFQQLAGSSSDDLLAKLPKAPKEEEEKETLQETLKKDKYFREYNYRKEKEIINRNDSKNSFSSSKFLGKETIEEKKEEIIKERPRLNLQKRSIPLEFPSNINTLKSEDSEEKNKKKSDPFGGAKPREEVLKTRSIEVSQEKITPNVSPSISPKVSPLKKEVTEEVQSSFSNLSISSTQENRYYNEDKEKNTYRREKQPPSLTKKEYGWGPEKPGNPFEHMKRSNRRDQRNRTGYNNDFKNRNPENLERENSSNRYERNYNSRNRYNRNEKNKFHKSEDNMHNRNKYNFENHEKTYHEENDRYNEENDI